MAGGEKRQIVIGGKRWVIVEGTSNRETYPLRDVIRSGGDIPKETSNG